MLIFKGTALETIYVEVSKRSLLIFLSQTGHYVGLSVIIVGNTYPLVTPTLT